MVVQHFAFMVEGSKGDIYRVAFNAAGQETTASCSCRAGMMGIWCKHRSALLNGDITALRSGNTDDVVALGDALRGTDLEASYVQLAAPGNGVEPASRPITRLPFAVGDRVAMVADIPGTGVKAGHVGEVAFVQYRGREIGYSTDLAPTAFLVRFTGGAEIWTTAAELMPARGKPLTKWATSQSSREQRVISRTRFRDGLAEGWTFSVSESFKAALDIAPTPRVLSRRSSLVKELDALCIEMPVEAIAGDQHALARLTTALHQAGVAVTDIAAKREAGGEMRVVITLETEGSPPAYSFAPGDIMHEPAVVHRLPWGEALLLLRRSVQVERATPARAADGASDAGQPGEVRATLRRYAEGKIVSTATLTCSQAEFVRLLRDGVEPGTLR